MHHALELMETHHKNRNIASDLVFPSPSNRLGPWNSSNSRVSVLEKTNIEDFCFHDLRHLAASYLAILACGVADLCSVLVSRFFHIQERYTSYSLGWFFGFILFAGLTPLLSLFLARWIGTETALSFILMLCCMFGIMAMMDFHEVKGLLLSLSKKSRPGSLISYERHIATALWL